MVESLTVVANKKELGQAFKGAAKAVGEALEKLSEEQAEAMMVGGWQQGGWGWPQCLL